MLSYSVRQASCLSVSDFGTSRYSRSFLPLNWVAQTASLSGWTKSTRGFQSDNELAVRVPTTAPPEILFRGYFDGNLDDSCSHSANRQAGSLSYKLFAQPVVNEAAEYLNSPPTITCSTPPLSSMFANGVLRPLLRKLSGSIV